MNLEPLTVNCLGKYTLSGHHTGATNTPKRTPMIASPLGKWSQRLKPAVSPSSSSLFYSSLLAGPPGSSPETLEDSSRGGPSLAVLEQLSLERPEARKRGAGAEARGRGGFCLGTGARGASTDANQKCAF